MNSRGRDRWGSVALGADTPQRPGRRAGSRAPGSECGSGPTVSRVPLADDGEALPDGGHGGDGASAPTPRRVLRCRVPFPSGAPLLLWRWMGVAPRTIVLPLSPCAPRPSTPRSSLRRTLRGKHAVWARTPVRAGAPWGGSVRARRRREVCCPVGQARLSGRESTRRGAPASTHAPRRGRVGGRFPVRRPSCAGPGVKRCGAASRGSGAPGCKQLPGGAGRRRPRGPPARGSAEAVDAAPASSPKVCGLRLPETRSFQLPLTRGWGAQRVPWTHAAQP